MKYAVLSRMVALAVITMFFYSCQKSDDIVLNNEFSTNSTEDVLIDEFSINSDEYFSLNSKTKKSKGFVHGIVIDIDGTDYYFAGPNDGPNGENDVPGHDWVQAGSNKVVAKHYNTGPFGASKWWSSDAADGALLYKVHGIIDTWSLAKAKAYYKKGFVHYHEFIKVSDGTLHPTKVVWLKHTAVTTFTLDGGPGAPNPAYEHAVSPGIDFKFPNNSFNPY